jgi:pseudomonalisin
MNKEHMMKKHAVAALAFVFVLTSCSGGSGTRVLPRQPGSQVTQTQPHRKMSAPAGWAATNTGILALANAVDAGALPATQSLTVRVGLQLRNESQLQSAVASGQQISGSTFMSTYAPTSAQVSAVTSYLTSQGFTSIQAEPNNLIVSATGTAAQVESAFNTKLENYTLSDGSRVYANTQPAYVPQSLGGTVVAVLGLSNAQAAKVTPKNGSPSPAPSPTPAGTPESPCSLYGLEILAFPTGPITEPTSNEGCLRNYRPADYWRAYDVGNTPVASNVNVSVMSAGQLNNAVSDVRVNESADGIPQVPIVVKQVGLQGGPITDGPDEWTLDMTASSGMAGAVKTIYLYNTTSLNDSDIVLMYNHWVTDHLAKIGNSSFGGCEAFEYLDGAMLLADEIFLQGASQGQTMFASAGDTGSFCPVEVGVNGVPAGAPLVNWPAASPYVTSVGGTTLVTDNAGNYQGETAWYSGGGGLSQFEYSPYWEAEAQPVSQQGESFRGVPDIAMDGDLQTGMILYTTDFGWTIIGGTSLSSPLAAGVYARLLQSHPTLGFAPPQLYKNFSSNAAGAQQTGPPPWQPDGGFHDILVGGNGMYTALPGYDYTTGLGSFDVSVMNGQI